MRTNFAVLLLLILVCAVPSQSQSSNQQAANDARIVCSLTLQNLEWRTINVPTLTIEVENTSDDDVELDASAALILMPNLLSNEPGLGQFWAPVDIRRDSPAEMNKHPRIQIAKHSKRKFDIHPVNMNWDRQLSSFWPAKKLFSLVSEGQYTLQLQTNSDKGDIVSNAVTIAIRKS